MVFSSYLFIFFFLPLALLGYYAFFYFEYLWQYVAIYTESGFSFACANEMSASRAEQSRAEQSRAEQSRAEQRLAVLGLTLGQSVASRNWKEIEDRHVSSSLYPRIIRSRNGDSILCSGISIIKKIKNTRVIDK